MIYVDSRTNGKGSHIRKSLRTIEEMISGSEKRWKDNIPADPRSFGVASSFSDVNSSDTNNAKTMQQPSLTGVMPARQERSRRSLIGGKPIENDKNDLTHKCVSLRLNI